MAGGPLQPISSYPVDAGKTFPYVYTGAGSGSRHEEMLGVMASVSADCTWRLRFLFPPTLPSGTCKLRVLTLANKASLVAKFNPKWASVAPEEDPSSATLNAEGTQTVTWSTGDADQYKETKVALDADTPVAGEVLVMDVVFETASWTLDVVSGWYFSVIWE